MCLILFSYNQHPGYRLVLAANRDEFLERPTAPLDYHFSGEPILAGKDLRGGGTWLALGKYGHLAAITNYRDPARMLTTAPSRGEIILNYLRSECSAADFLHKFATEAKEYNGFNLLLADRNDLLHFSNITGQTTQLTPGIYGLSNHLLNTPWPKVERGRKVLQQALVENVTPDREKIFRLLASDQRPEDAFLPETGIGLEWERVLSSIFIHSPNYGTRSSAVITMADDGAVNFNERSFTHDAGVRAAGERSFSVTL